MSSDSDSDWSGYQRYDKSKKCGCRPGLPHYCKPYKKKCGKPKCECGKCRVVVCHINKSHYCDQPWPPCPPCKKGRDIIRGNIDANTITADVIKGGPQKVYIPGTYKNIDDALDAALSPSEGGPIGGYHYILKHGVRKVHKNHILSILNATFEAQSWTPTMANSYIVGAGHSMRLLTHLTNYDQCIGGIGPYCIKICDGYQIEVSSHCKDNNPNFDSLGYGDHIYWRYAGEGIGGTEIIKKYKIRSTCNNQITLDCKLDTCTAKIGEGFWVANRTSISFKGNRTLLLGTGGQLEFRGLHLQSEGDCGYGDSLVQLVTGASNGITSMIHSQLATNTIQYGDSSWLVPNVVTRLLRLPAGTSGSVLFTSWIGKQSGIFLDQSLVLFGAALLLGCDLGMQIYGSSGSNLVGSTVHDCIIGTQVEGASFNCPGTLFSLCSTAILAKASGRVTSTVSEFRGLLPLTIRACTVAFNLNNKISGIADRLFVSNNTTDLILDDTIYNELSSYVSGTPGSLISTLEYILASS